MNNIYYTQNSPPARYYQYPAFLLECDLSETARLVYILILSRIRLSQQNGWVNGQGHIYCRFPIAELARQTHKCKNTISNALSELERQQLLTRHRDGPGYPNRLYLRHPENCARQSRNSGNETPNKLGGNQNTSKETEEYLGGGL